MTKRNFHKQSLMGIFLSYFRPHMGLFLLDMVCALVISLVDLGFPYLSRMCMYELIPEGRFQAFVAVILILLAAYLIRSVMQYIVTYWPHLRRAGGGGYPPGSFCTCAEAAFKIF